MNMCRYGSWYLRRFLWRIRQTKQVIHPSWLDRPFNIQIDTHNYCNLACEYCNVKDGASFNLPRGRMSDDILWYVIKYWGKHGIGAVCPYVNGEPLLDERLLKICDYTVEHTNAINIIDTNGSVWRNRHLLVHPNAKTVRFTISANTKETYRKVHGKDLFKDAINTFWWFNENRYPTQDLRLHFIVTKNNMNEIEDWIKRFKGFQRRVFPLHRMEGIQKDSVNALPEKGFWRENERPLIVHPNEKRELHQLHSYEMCQGTWSITVSWDGRIIHCTDAPYKYNYGHVYEVDMMEAWQKRIRRLNHPACEACTVKRPDWKPFLRKYLGETA